MKRSKHSQLWVKAALGFGVLLGLLLLVQTIATYFFVYDKIVRDEASQEVERKQASLLRSAAIAGIRDAHLLQPVLAEVQRDSPREVAWIRILDMDAQLLAQVGDPATKLPTSAELRRQLERHRSNSQVVQTAKGRVLVENSRLRFFGPPARPPRGAVGGGPPDLSFIEFGIYMEGVTLHLGALRQNLIVGCLASLSLLASMILIAFLFNRYIRARQLEQQVELARRVQTDLLPADDTRQSENLNFSAAFHPAATVGGDFYDVFRAESGAIAVVLGDVAGKGISAALLMGVLHGAIRSMQWTRSAAEQESASQWLNRFLCDKTALERFVSLFWAYFDPVSGMLHYVNAGHLPPLLIKASNSECPKVQRLEDGGPVLGLLRTAEYRSGVVHVDAGDVLVIYSDGIAEATNGNDEEFGETRIAEIVGSHIHDGPQQIRDAVLAGVTNFLGDLKPHDDQTLLLVRLCEFSATTA